MPDNRPMRRSGISALLKAIVFPLDPVLGLVLVMTGLARRRRRA
jgi:hypothetical protein